MLIVNGTQPAECTLPPFAYISYNSVRIRFSSSDEDQSQEETDDREIVDAEPDQASAADAQSKDKNQEPVMSFKGKPMAIQIGRLDLKAKGAICSRCYFLRNY